jgi:hypothetical protein
MRRFKRAAAVGVFSMVLAALVPVSAVAGPENNPSSRTITFNCPSGQVTATAVADGVALLDEGGGVVAVGGGIATLEGQELSKINPGLQRQGKLEACTYFSVVRQQTLVAYLYFLP